jgi:leader peptidase (prepilin peptidase)/N-methyltransferase
VTLPWIIAGATVGLLAGPWIRAAVFARSIEAGQPLRIICPACSAQVLPGRWRWLSVLPVTGGCPACRTPIGPYPLAAEAAAGLALAAAAARTTSAWELAALAWLILIAIPLAFTDLDELAGPAHRHVPRACAGRRVRRRAHRRAQGEPHQPVATRAVHAGGCARGHRALTSVGSQF